MGLQVSGSFKNIEDFFDRIINHKYYSTLEKYGERGVAALKAATPVDSGKTAGSWSYELMHDDMGNLGIVWSNSNVVQSAKGPINIAVILDFGHGKRNGGYVRGRHYIKPALQPIFDQMAEELWREVTR